MCESGLDLASSFSQVVLQQDFVVHRMGQDGSSGGTDEDKSGEEPVASNPQLPAISNLQPCPLVLSPIQPDCDQEGDVGDQKQDSRYILKIQPCVAIIHELASGKLCRMSKKMLKLKMVV